MDLTNPPAVVRLPCRFDPAAVETIRARLTILVDQPGIDAFVVDGGDVEEVSSSALGLLIALRHAATVRGHEFVIRNPSRALTSAIVASGLQDRLLGDLCADQWWAAWSTGLASNA